MLSAEGIQPLPEKLDSITNMPAPENKNEVKHFLGLVGTITNSCPTFLTFQDYWRSWWEKTHHSPGWSNVTWPSTCSKTNSVRLPYSITPIAVNPTCCSQMLGVWNWSKRKGLERTISCHICQWFVPWKPAELGSPNKGSICYISLSQETGILHHRCRHHIEEWPPSPQKIPAEEHP